MSDKPRKIGRRPEIRTECSPEFRIFVDRKVKEYGLKSPAEYVRRLIYKEMQYEYKKTRSYKLHKGTEYVVTCNLEPYKRFTADSDFEIEPYFPESEGWDMWEE